VARSQTQVAAARPVVGVWTQTASTHASAVQGSPSSQAAPGAQRLDVMVVLVVAPVAEVLLVVGRIVEGGLVDVLVEVLDDVLVEVLVEVLDDVLVELVEEVVVVSQMSSVGPRQAAFFAPGLMHCSPTVHGSPSSQSVLSRQAGSVPPPGGPIGSAPAGCPKPRSSASATSATNAVGWYSTRLP
jgi:hypothetical protein